MRHEPSYSDPDQEIFKFPLGQSAHKQQGYQNLIKTEKENFPCFYRVVETRMEVCEKR